MIHINNIEIKDFFGFSHLMYSPRDLNIIVGKNNSGKSTILKAIRQNIQPLPKVVPYYLITSLLKNYVKIGKKCAIIESNLGKIEIYEKYVNLPENIKIKVEEKITSRLKKIEKKITLKYEFIIKLYNLLLESHSITTIVFGGDILIYPSFDGESQNFFQTIKQFEEFRTNVPATEYQGSLYNIFSEELSNNEFIENKLNVVFLDTSENTMMHRIPSDDIRLLKLEDFIRQNNLIPNFFRLTNESVIYQDEKGDKYSLSLQNHGSGFLSLLTIFSAIEASQNGILLLEEPENHLHPGYLGVFIDILFKHIKEKKIQVFISTHSYDLLQEIINYPKTKKAKELVLISMLSKDIESSDLFNYSVAEAQYEMDSLRMDLRGI